MLQLVSQPYVHSLYEEIGVTGNDRKFIASKVDFFGRIKNYPFLLSDTDKSPSHPFASFKLRSTGENFYVYGEGLSEDAQLRQSLCKD